MRLTTADLKRYRRLQYTGLPPGKPTGSGETPPPPKLAPGVVERNRATLELIEAFIAWLPDEYTRDVVLLKYARGYTWTQIAQRIGGTTPESLAQLVYAELRRFNSERNEG